MYTPVVSFSIWSRSAKLNSSISGIGGGGASTAFSAMPNSEIWPSTMSLWRFAAPSIARSNTLSFCARPPGRPSIAPERIRLSTPFLFRSDPAMRLMKSYRSRNSPFARRSLTSAATGAWPRLLIAAKPKRMTFFPSETSTVNFSSERFTSGGSTGMPRLRQFWM